MLKFWKRLNRYYDRLLRLLLIPVLLIAAWCIWDNYYVYSRAENDDLLRYKPGQSDGSGGADGDSGLDGMVAWLTAEGAGIDAPVMQAEDNLTYLNRDPLGHYALSGSIFLDCRCSADFSDPYSLIYGHHMERGKMFGGLDAYLDAGYLASHSRGTLMIGTDGGEVHRLEIFAAMRADDKEPAVFDPGTADVRAYIAQHADVFAADSRRSSRILGLSTCADESTARIVVFCYILDE